MKRKYLGSVLFLVILIAATIFVLLKSNDMRAVLAAIAAVQLTWLALGILAALLFVAGEGMIIWYLLRALNIPVHPPQCIRWSFVGFFFSAITPSATGGQPAQVYYMKREGVRIADSTPVLMVVAVLYKFVLVVLGLALMAVAGNILRGAFGGLLWLYYLGLGLNILLVAILVFVMVTPHFSRRVVSGLEALLEKLHLLKPSPARHEKLMNTVEEYQNVVRYFRGHPGCILTAVGMTFLQRSTLFVLTWFIYRGLGLRGADLVTVLVLQASVYIAVDMLPLPGSMGANELVYSTVFAAVFPGQYLAASLCINRGVSFYLVLLISAAALGVSQLMLRRAAPLSAKLSPKSHHKRA